MSTPFIEQAIFFHFPVEGHARPIKMFGGLGFIPIGFREGNYRMGPLVKAEWIFSLFNPLAE